MSFSKINNNLHKQANANEALLVLSREFKYGFNIRTNFR